MTETQHHYQEATYINRFELKQDAEEYIETIKDGLLSRGFRIEKAFVQRGEWEVNPWEGYVYGTRESNRGLS